MTTPHLSITVADCVPWARARVARRGKGLRFFTANEQAMQGRRIKRAIRDAKCEKIPAGVPVRVELVFRVRGQITAKPDVDNLAKLVLDAMTKSGVYHDDSQVVEVLARKTPLEDGALVERTEISVWRVD